MSEDRFMLVAFVGLACALGVMICATVMQQRAKEAPRPPAVDTVPGSQLREARETIYRLRLENRALRDTCGKRCR